jgi:hypothetical protein
LQGLSDVLWHLVFSSYKGYLNWMQVLELRVLSKPHEPRDVLFDQEIDQLPPADFVSVLLPHHFGVAASFVPARTSRGSQSPIPSGFRKMAHKRWRA